MSEPRNEWNRPPSPCKETSGLRKDILGPKYPTCPHSWDTHKFPEPFVFLIQILRVLSWVLKGFPRRWPTRSWAHHSTIMKRATMHRIEPCINSCFSVTSATPTTLTNDSSQSLELFFSIKRWVCVSIFLRSLTWQSALLIWVSWFIYQDLRESFCYPGNHHEQIILALILLK